MNDVFLFIIVLFGIIIVALANIEDDESKIEINCNVDSSTYVQDTPQYTLTIKCKNLDN